VDGQWGPALSNAWTDPAGRRAAVDETVAALAVASRIPVRCFMFNPTVKSSLTFLRKTPWARKRVEDWFVRELK